MTQDIGIRLTMDGVQQVEAGARRVSGAMDTVGGAANAVSRAMAGVAGAFAGALSVREFIQAADAVTSLQNQLKLATGSAQAAGYAYNQLYEIAQRSRTGFVELGTTFASISTAAADLGVSQQRLLQVTEAIGNAVTISGAGAQAAQAALVQLGQGLASGTLRGEELNSVMEQTPRLAKALADGLGVTRGELRALGAQGAITADQVIKALESQSDVLKGEVQSAVLTVSQAFTQLKNEAVVSVGVIDQAAGATSLLASALGSVGVAVRDLRETEALMDSFTVIGQTVTVLFNDVAFVLKSIGREIGGIAAQAAAIARLDFGGAALIRREMVADATAARAALDASQARILAPRERPQVIQGGGGGRGAVNPETVGAAMAKEAAAADELMKIRQKLYGVDKDYLPTLSKLHAQYESGRLTLTEYRELVAKLAEANTKKAKTSSDAAKELREQQNAYEQLISAVNVKIAQEREELAGGGALADSRKLQIKLEQELASGKVKLSVAQKASVQAAIEELAVVEQARKAAEAIKFYAAERLAAQEELNAAYVSESRAREQGRQTVADYSRGIDESNAALQLEISLMGKSDVARTIAIEQYRIELDLKRQIAAIDANVGFDEAQREEERARVRAKAAIAAANVSARAVLDEWRRTTDEINRSLTDALLRGFESGKGFAQNLRDTLKNMFNTLVLRPIISAVINPVAGAITGALGLAGSAAAAGSGGSSGLGMLGNIGSAVSAGTSALGIGASYGFQSLFANGLGATLSAGGSMIGAGSIASGLGTIAGALGPIALGVGALMAIAKATKGETRYGGGFEVVDGRAFRTTGDVTNTLPESAIVQSVQGTFDTINKLLGQYGSEFVATNIKAGIETSGKGRGGVFAGGLLEGLDGNSVKFGKFFEDRIGASLNPEEAVKAFGGELNKAVIAALQTATDLPKYVQRQIAEVDVNTLGVDKAAELLQTVGNLPNVLLQGYGATRDALVQQFAQGLALGDAAAAGQSVADTLVASIEASLYTDAAGKIFDIVNGGIVAPMLDAISTGASVSEALSQASIDKTIERAKAQAAALGELFANSEFTAALDQIRATVGEALGQAGGAFGYTPKYQIEAAQQIDTAAQDAARAAEEAQKAWQQITDGLLSDRTSAEIALLRAQGREEEAIARERARAIEGFDAYQIGLYDGTQAILNQVTALEKQAEAAELARERAEELADTLRGELPGVIDKFLNPEQRVSAGYGRIAADLGAAGINVAADTLASATKDQIAAAVVQLYNLGTTSDETRLALIRAASGLADLKEQAYSLAQSQTDAAFNALQREVNARRDVLQETITDVRSVFEAVGEAARALMGDVASTSSMMGAQGRDFLGNALSNARLTGYLPDPKELQRAISAVTNDLGKQVYATQFDADRDRLLLAGTLSDLEDISGDQLTEAEKQLKSLDGILDNARQQIDALRGIDTSVQGVDARIAALAVALGAEQAARNAAKVGGGGGGGGAPGGPLLPSWANFGKGDWITNAGGSLVADANTGTIYGQDGQQLFRSSLVNAATALIEAGQSMDVYDAIKQSGFTLAQADKVLGLGAGTAEEWAKAMGLPIFHTGTPYVPYTGAALLQQGERVIDAPSNRLLMSRLTESSGNAELVAEMRAMRAEFAALKAEVGRGADAAEQVADQFDDVTGGGVEMRMRGKVVVAA